MFHCPGSGILLENWTVRDSGDFSCEVTSASRSGANAIRLSAGTGELNEGVEVDDVSEETVQVDSV